MKKYAVPITLIITMIAGAQSAQAGGYHGHGGHRGGGWGHSYGNGVGHGWHRPYCPPKRQIVYVEPYHHGFGHHPHYEPVYVSHYTPRPRETFGFFVRY